MRNRLTSHLLVLFALVGLEIVGYIAIHRAALIRGYETSWIGGVRDLLIYLPIIVLALWISAVKKFKGNWALFTTAILLFSIGLVVQYRLYSDPEYNARNKAEARQEKTDALRIRYINENYDATKRQMMGLGPAPPPGKEAEVPVKESTYTIANALTAGYTWIPILSLIGFALAYGFCVNDRFLTWVQRNSFIIVLLTLVPLAAAIISSSAGKAAGNTTPWEPAKVPFLLGFAGILTARYKDLARTYWGIPRARDIVPLVVMAMIPFIPFFALKDFGQMLIFSGAYATLYLVAVRRWPQLLLFVGSVMLVIAILVVGALPRDVQEKVPLLPTVARPIQHALPARIQQRFHLWLDGFDPPSPEESWWKKDYDDALAKGSAHEGTRGTERGDEEECQHRHLVRQARLSASASGLWHCLGKDHRPWSGSGLPGGHSDRRLGLCLRGNRRRNGARGGRAGRARYPDFCDRRNSHFNRGA